MRILLDEMYDGLAALFEKHGHQVYHVGKLKKDNAKFANDFNVILHAKEQKLVLITNDGETGRACKDNNVTCILVNINTVFEKIILPELKTLESV